MHAAVQTRENVCSLCGLARCSAFISVFDSVESLSENFVCCLLPTVLNDIRLSSRSCFRSFERKILSLEENDFSCRWPLSRQVRTAVSTKRPDIDAWDCMHGLQPPAFCARWSSNLPHHSRFLPSSTFPFLSPPFSLALALQWSATNGTLRRPWLCAVSADLHQAPTWPSCRHHPCSSRDSRSSVGRLRIVLPKITSQKLASYF